MSIDLGLDRVRALSAHLPPYTRPTIHVAGTNGKGSVSAILSSILSSPSVPSSGPLLVGRYNSPHLVARHDCISLSGSPVPIDAFNAAYQIVASADTSHNMRCTPFELLTLTALLIFEQKKVDMVVLEVGMGGRLDATNMINDDVVLVSALTSVGLDHVGFLGDTVGKIAKEKASIARRGKPFVLAYQMHDEVVGVVGQVVNQVGGWVVPAISVEIDRDVPLEAPYSLLDAIPGKDNEVFGPPAQRIRAVLPHLIPSTLISTDFPLHGAHQLDNLGTALAVIDALLAQDQASPKGPDLCKHLTKETIERGIRNVVWPGRLSFHTIALPVRPEGEGGPGDLALPLQVRVLADGAHNKASAETLASYLSSLVESTARSARGAVPSSLVPTNPPVLPLTLVLGLSHSPPKTPDDTIAPLFTALLRDAALKFPTIKISLGVALLPFTPPAGMPWVRPVHPDLVREAAVNLAPGLGADCIWVASDPVGGLTEDSEGERGEIQNRKRNKALEDALGWAARRHIACVGEQESGTQVPGLVVIAGSLYLVADFYRMLGWGSDGRDV